MRVTVSQQQTEALQEERPETSADVSKRFKSVKCCGMGTSGSPRAHRCLVGGVEFDLGSFVGKKVADSLSEFGTYIRNNREFIPNLGERRRQRETISRRFVKKQQVQ
jgi:hypothetical protein